MRNAILSPCLPFFSVVIFSIRMIRFRRFFFKANDSWIRFSFSINDNGGLHDDDLAMRLMTRKPNLEILVTDACQMSLIKRRNVIIQRLKYILYCIVHKCMYGMTKFIIHGHTDTVWSIFVLLTYPLVLVYRWQFGPPTKKTCSRPTRNMRRIRQRR